MINVIGFIYFLYLLIQKYNERSDTYRSKNESK